MWLYVPNVISSPSAQASEGLTLASSLPSPTLDLLEEVWFTWRGKRRQPRLWSRLWKRGGWIRRLSGLTCEHSTLSLGVDRFISSLAATPAKTIALPEKARGQADNGSLLPKSAALPRSAGLILSSAKTSRGTRMDKSRPLSRHWSDWATALRQEYSRRPKPEIPCGGNDCSSWPSVRTSDTNGVGLHGDGGMDLRTAASNWHAPRANDAEKRGEIASDPRNGLVAQSEHWMAPKASDADHGGPNMRDSKGGIPLPPQAMAASQMWAAPTANNPKGSSEGSSEGSIVRADGKVRDDSPHYQAEQFFNPQSSSPDQPIVAGAMSSTDFPNTNQPSVKRKLNPIFVEALMRWPTGLSGFVRQETALTLWSQRMLSYLSVLCSRKPDSQTSLFD